MNKKRLYKQSGKLHPRGERIASRIHNQIRALFLDHDRFHPRDLAQLIVHEACFFADLHANHKEEPAIRKV